MAENVGLRMATATKEDIDHMFLLYNILDFMNENDCTCLDDFNEMELSIQERNFLSQIFEDDEIDINSFVQYLKGLLHGFHRVVFGYQTLFDNCADPNLGHLDFNKSLKEAITVWNHLAEHLKEGREVCITPDSTLGQMILISEKESEKKEEEVSNG